MPVYEYKCRECELVLQDYRPVDRRDDATYCPRCDSPDFLRIPSSFGIQRATRFQEGFNPSLGRHVSNMRDLKDGLKEASEAHAARTGFEANYVPVDPRESKESLGVTEEGLDETYRKEVAAGSRNTQLWL